MSTGSSERRDPFSIRGGAVLLVTSVLEVVSALTFVAMMRHDGPTVQLVAFACGSALMAVALGTMWLTKYYMPARRKAGQEER